MPPRGQGRIARDADRLGYCGALVRQQDPDRFLTALFAPPARRPALFALYAFNQEVAKTRESVSEPMLGEIRLQWWRDAIAAIYAGNVLQHQVVGALSDAVSRFDLSRELFDRLIDSRAADLSDAAPADVAALCTYASGTAGTLTQLALEALGQRDADALAAGEEAGIAWSLTGLLRALPHHVRARRRFLPDEVIARHGVALDDMMELRSSPALASAVRDVAAEAKRRLRAARAERTAVGRAGRTALLTCTLADSYLARMARAGHDPFAPGFGAPAPLRPIPLALKAATGRY